MEKAKVTFTYLGIPVEPEDRPALLVRRLRYAEKHKEPFIFQVRCVGNRKRVFAVQAPEFVSTSVEADMKDKKAQPLLKDVAMDANLNPYVYYGAAIRLWSGSYRA